MQRVQGFWASAYSVADRVPVADFAARAGGWSALARGGVPELRRLGMAERWVQRWQHAPPIESRFRVLRITDPEYPHGLRGMCDAPPLLFVDGSVQAIQQRAVAIVGTRRCTSYGIGVARAVSVASCQAGRVVISGLAFGIDRHAHQATFGCGTTVAVLASGLGSTSPRSHRWLRERIVADGGAIVSVWADDFQASRYTFPYRNRWIAALSECTVVVEAPLKSGALHTASHAAELSRTVWAVPGRIGDHASEGCNQLIEQGASSLLSIQAFSQGLGGMGPPDWLGALELGQDLSCVAELAGVSVAELLDRVHRMEARGQLVRLPGNRYARAGYR